MAILRLSRLSVFMVATILIFSREAKADYPPFCQVKLISQPLICSSSGQAKYKVFFQNLVPKKLFWTNLGKNTESAETVETAKTEESDPNFLATIEQGKVAFTTQNSNKELIMGGSLWAKGEKSEKEQADFFVVKLSKKGEIAWTQAVGSPDKNEVMMAEANTSDGGMILAGESEEDNGNKDWILLRYNQKGDIVWSKKTEFESRRMTVRSIKQTADGGFIVAGFDEKTDKNLTLVKYDERGEVVWSKKMPVSIKDSCQIERLEDDNFVVVGDIEGAESKNDTAAFMLKIDQTGKIIWSKKWENKGKISILSSVGKTVDGSFVVAGETDNFGSNMDVILAKYSSSGEIIWSRRIDNQGGEKAAAIRQDPDKNIVLVGESFGSDERDGLIVKLDENGKVIWAKKEAGRNFNQLKSLDFTSKGEIIVGGNQIFTNKINFFKLDQNGDILGCEKLESIKVGERKVDLVMSENNLSTEEVQPKNSEEDLATSAPFFSAQNTCEYSFSNELTKEFSYGESGIYNPELLVENGQGEKVQCQSLSQVELMDGGKCQIKLFHENGELLESKMDWQKGLVTFKIFAGQLIIAKPELKCIETYATQWEVVNGEVLSSSDELLEAKFFAGGLAKIKANVVKDPENPDGEAFTCEEANIIVKEKMRYGF